MRKTGFCCEGCSYVFRMVHAEGFDGYYDFRAPITAPAGSNVFQTGDFAWLEAEQSTAEAAAKDQPAIELTLSIQGISCAACVWLIERIFNRTSGARTLFINVQYGTLRLRWSRGEFSATDFARKLQSFGYLVGPAADVRNEPESRSIAKRIGLCAAFTMNVMLFSLPTYFGMEPGYEWAGLFSLLSFLFGTLSLLAGGAYFITRATRALRERATHIDLPISLGVIGAYAGSVYGWLSGNDAFVYFDFVSGFILLMLIGRWAQVVAVERNRRRLLEHQPKPEHIGLADGSAIASDAINRGDIFRLRANQTNPVEARLGGSQAIISLASISGESRPRVFREGQTIPSGAVNVGRNEISVTALQPWGESLLAQLLKSSERLIEEAPFIGKIVRGYLLGIIGIALLAGLGWWMATGDGLKTGAVVVAVLVVSCPCAIALAFPLADEFATVALRRHGVFIRDASVWFKLHDIRTVAFDKTGTLTFELPVLQNPEALQELSDQERSALYSLVQENPHPVSQSLREHLLSTGTAPSTIQGESKETIGFGVEIDGWTLGRAGWRTPTNQGDGTTFAHAGRTIAVFHFTDLPRTDAKAELNALQRRGLTTVILSGDHPETVTHLATSLELPSARAIGGLTPREKAEWITHKGKDQVMMLGDGANDSLAFDSARCRGTPAIHRTTLQQKADFYYLGRGISGVRALFEVNAVRERTQTVILVFSILYNVSAVSLAVAGHVNPLVAAILMPVNSLLTFSLVTLCMRTVLRKS